jgi:hypothetical protein
MEYKMPKKVGLCMSKDNNISTHQPEHNSFFLYIFNINDSGIVQTNTANKALPTNTEQELRERII